MYIKKDFLALTADELTDYTARDFKLCYVDTCEKLDLRDDNGERSAIGLRLMFTPIDLKEQWGDDWNDAPYDCNAGWPYDSLYVKRDDNGEYIKYDILILNVTMPLEHRPTLPLDYGYNTPFTAETINQGACAWMFFADKCKPIYAGATPLDVLERIGKWLVPCPEFKDEW